MVTNRKPHVGHAQQRHGDQRVAYIRDAVLRHFEHADPCGAAGIIGIVAAVLEDRHSQSLRDNWHRIADAVAVLAAALDEEGIADVHAEAIRQRKTLDEMESQKAAEDSAVAALVAVGFDEKKARVYVESAGRPQALATVELAAGGAVAGA